VLCAADFLDSDVRIRADVGGDHESLQFTITTPEGTDTKTENRETYDSNNFWATLPGTYTINAKLYSEDNLRGTLCGELTLTFTVEAASDCANLNPCDELAYTFSSNNCVFTNINNAEHLLVVYSNNWSYRGHCAGNCSGAISIPFKSFDRGLNVVIFDKSWKEVCRKYIDISGRIADEGSISSNRVSTISTSDLRLSQTTLSLENAAAITLFPNPASTSVSMDLQSLVGKGIDLKLYNNLGQLVYQQRLEEITNGLFVISTAQFKNGLYLLEIQGKDGLSVTKKLMINQ